MARTQGGSNAGCIAPTEDAARRSLSSGERGVVWPEGSQIASQCLLALDGLEQRLEVALAEAAGAVALDDLEEDRRAVAERLGEDLQQVALVVAIDEDAQALQVGERLGDLAHPLRDVVVIGLRRLEELDAALLQRRDGADDVAGGERDVLRARALVELEVLVDLRLALALGRLVDRELHA